MITQQQIAESKKVFEAIYGISEYQHNLMVYEAGLKRISIIARSSEAMQSKLESSSKFWGWWKQDWNIKNIAAMETIGFDPYSMPARVLKHERDALKECINVTHADTSFLTYPSKVLV